jgi:formylglycine-generating enzyme required for sulfatase activity
MEQVFVPAGILHMGGFDTNAENDEFPSRELQMNAFWVDRFEVTNEMYSVCMEAGGCPKFHVVESQDRPDYFTNTTYKDYPVVNVSWAEAQGYCQWAGRRLPSEAEWERAARGDDLRTFPWGDDLPNEKYSNSDNIVSDTSRVGSYSAGASPFGAMDMAGNVWEWTADFYNVDFYANAGNQFPAGPTEAPGKYLRVIRGGSFLDSYLDLRVSNRGNVMGPNPLVLPENNLYRGSAS